MQHRRLVGLLAVGAMVASACTGQPAGSSGASGPAATGGGDATIKIGAILPLTGDGAAYGPGMEIAARAALDEVNAAGGVNGKKLELLVEDDATNADQGVRAASKLIDVNKVSAIIGTWASSVTLAVAPLTIKANIIEMNVSGSPKITDLQDNGTVFRANATDAALGETVGKQFYADGSKTMTVVTNNAAGTIGLAQAVRDAFSAAGGKINAYVEYAEKQPSYSTEVNKALATKPDLYFLSCYTPDGTQIIKAMYEGGATAKVAGPAWCLNGQLADALGAATVEGDMGVDLVPVKESKAYQRLAEAYKAKAGKDVFDNVYAVHVYDSVLLLALAMQKAGNTDGDKVGTALTDISNAPGTKVESFADGLTALTSGKDVDYEGASGPIDFNQAGDMAPFAGILEFKGGKPVLTKTFSAPGQ